MIRGRMKMKSEVKIVDNLKDLNDILRLHKIVDLKPARQNGNEVLIIEYIRDESGYVKMDLPEK